MTPIALVAVTTLSSGLPAVTGPVHWVRGPLYLLLYHDDLVLVLHTAPAVTVLTAARVVLGAQALELDLDLVLRVTPVASPAAAPAHHHLSRPAAAPAHHHVPGPAARPAGVPLNTTSTVLGVSVRLEPPPCQPVYLVLGGLPAGTVVSVSPGLPPLPVTPVAAPVTLVSLPVRLVAVRLVPVRPVPVLLGFTFCPPSLSVPSGVALSTGSLTLILLLLLMVMLLLLLMSECGEGGVGASRVPAR